MTFTALSTWVGWALVAAALLATLGAFLLRPRPPRQTIASLIVWRRVLDDVQQHSLWERARWIASLALTVLVAAALAAAFARPALRGTAAPSGRTLIVLDSSWTMRARSSSGGTRWQQAIAGARTLASAAGAGQVAIATTGEGLIEGPTSDIALVRGALDRLVPSGGVDGAWPKIAGDYDVHFFTDGAVARPMMPGLVVHSVFTPAPNVAVTAFDVQPGTASGSDAEVFYAIANDASASQSVHLTVSRESAVIVDRSVELAAGANLRDVIRVPNAGGARFHAHVSATSNDLDVDDDAVAWLWTAQPIKVAVITAAGAKSVFPAMLAKDASLAVSAGEAAAYSTMAADVWIFDRWLPADAPVRPAVIVDPPASSWLGPRATPESQPVWQPGAAHRILDGVDTGMARVSHTAAVTNAALVPIAVSTKGTPLISIEDRSGGRFVVLGFPVADSDFASTSGFPILIGNAIDWLGRPERGVRRQPGPAVLPATTRRVTAPNGDAVPLTRLDDRVTAVLAAPGLYLVETPGAQSVVTVGLDDPPRSNLLRSTIAGQQQAAPISTTAAARPWWQYAAVLALGLVAFESISWRRRITV